MVSMNLSFTSAVVILCLLRSAAAHHSIYTPAAWGMSINATWQQYFPEFAPLGPGWEYKSWWMRGFVALENPPPRTALPVNLPAGGKVKLEIACNEAFTTLGGWASNNVACNSNGPYHNSIDPNVYDPNGLSGCALSIYDGTNISAVTMDNLVVFSTNQSCVSNTRDHFFDVPAKMPACSSKGGCICVWSWLANFGTGNFYMTPFKCNVTGARSDSTKIAKPRDPVVCGGDEAWSKGVCTTGAKKLLYAYNQPTNVPWYTNDNRPGYHAKWSFPTNGAQNDIFLPPSAAKSLRSKGITPRRASSADRMEPIEEEEEAGY